MSDRDTPNQQLGHQNAPQASAPVPRAPLSIVLAIIIGTLPDITVGPRISMLCRGGHVLTMLRMIGGIATAITSIYVAVARDGHNMGDVAYTSLWCFALIGGAVLFMVWRHMSKMPNVYSFLAIVFFYVTQATLLEGPGLVLDSILPVLPLVVVSGSFLASLFLSFYKNMSSTQSDVEQSAWDVAASCLV